MAWPIVTIAVKLLWLKFLKGAAIGLGRYVHRLYKKEHVAPDGQTLEGMARVSHILKRETTAKDNVVFLLLMLGNFFFGLQELCLWIWSLVAKKLYTVFPMGMPAALEDPVALAERMRELPWKRIAPEMTRWLLIASLLYWPLPPEPRLRVDRTRNPKWVEIRFGRQTYLARTDVPGLRERYGLTIDVNASTLSVSAPNYDSVTFCILGEN